MIDRVAKVLLILLGGKKEDVLCLISFSHNLCEFLLFLVNSGFIEGVN